MTEFKELHIRLDVLEQGQYHLCLLEKRDSAVQVVIHCCICIL